MTEVLLNNFSGADVQFGSLIDGRYTLSILSAQITNVFGQSLDGDGDIQPGGNFVFGDAQGLFRLFGDVNGDQTVNGLDLGFFRNLWHASRRRELFELPRPQRRRRDQRLRLGPIPDPVRDDAAVR
jgi:hypothetical protein